MSLTACAGKEEEKPSTEELREGRSFSLNQHNPYAWKQEDVQVGKGNSITGGKRSRYDGRASQAFKRSGTAKYLEKSYQAKAWQGGKEYSRGSFKTESYRQAGKTSRFAGKQSSGSTQRFRESGKGYGTGTFSTGQAKEAGSGAYDRQGTSPLRARDSGFRPFDNVRNYRDLTPEDTKMMMGRD